MQSSAFRVWKKIVRLEIGSQPARHYVIISARPELLTYHPLSGQA